MATDIRAALAPPPGAGTPDLVARFAERVGAVGVTVHQVSDLDELALLVAELSRDLAGGDAVVAPGLAAARPALTQRLPVQGMRTVEVDPADPAASFAGVAIGISEALLGVAETGSLVVADALPDRLVRMLSPRHVVVLDAAWIIPGLDEAGALLREILLRGDSEGTVGRYVTFISGPSRTADIEMSLTVGAHGPAELHVAIVGSRQ
jgi:L-lactate dehydrogenase complex protein LldG